MKKEKELEKEIDKIKDEENIKWEKSKKCDEYLWHESSVDNMIKQGISLGRQTLKDELKWLKTIQENLLLGKRKKGQHKFNKISVQERIKKIQQEIKNEN